MEWIDNFHWFPHSMLLLGDEGYSSKSSISGTFQRWQQWGSLTMQTVFSDYTNPMGPSHWVDWHLLMAQCCNCTNGCNCVCSFKLGTCSDKWHFYMSSSQPWVCWCLCEDLWHMDKSCELCNWVLSVYSGIDKTYKIKTLVQEFHNKLSPKEFIHR